MFPIKIHNNQPIYKWHRALKHKGTQDNGIVNFCQTRHMLTHKDFLNNNNKKENYNKNYKDINNNTNNNDFLMYMLLAIISHLTRFRSQNVKKNGLPESAELRACRNNKYGEDSLS